MFAGAVAISLPALTTGWEPSDDLRHRAKLIDPSSLPERYFETGLIPDDSGKFSTVLRDLHTAARTKDDIKKLKDYGTLPWWTNDTLRHSNWRPLDSFTHWLDYRLFPNSAQMIHLHSILWLALVVFLVTVLYQRFIGPSWVAGLAALLYLLDDSNYWPTMWIANRNLLISLVFGILTLLSHHKWRKDNSLRAAIIAPFCLALSLLATEAGIATFAYLLAYAFVLDRASRVRRFVSMVPYLVLIVLWRIIYNVLGHGANDIAVFADPGREPLHYARLVVERLVVLLMGQWGFWSSEIFLLLSNSAKVMVWLGSLVFLVVVFITFLPLIRTARLARFWFAGMLLSVPPICATLPMNRNLLFVAIGSFALIAQFVGYIRNSNGLTSKSQLWRFMAFVVCVTLLFIHVLMSLTTRAAAPKAVAFLHDYVRRTVSIGAESELKNQDVIIMNAPNPFMCFFIPSIKAHNGEPLPRSMRILAPGFNSLEVVRTGGQSASATSKKREHLHVSAAAHLTSCVYVQPGQRSTTE